MDKEGLQVQKDIQSIKDFSYDQYFSYDYDKRAKVQISPNQQILALSSPLGQLTIFNLKKKIKIKKVNLSLKNAKFNKTIRISAFKFSLNSKYLLCCAQFGRLYIFRVDGNLKLINILYLHQSPISEILLIDDRRIITSPQIGNIKISDFINKICTLDIPYYQYNNFDLQFDSINQLVITSSTDHSVKFYSMQDGQVFIDAQNIDDHEYIRIFLVNNNKQLVTSSQNSLKQWQIDHQNQQLVLIKQFIHEKAQFHFQVLNQQGFIGISSTHIYLIDNDFNLIGKTKHNITKIKNFYTNQADSIQFIVVFGLQMNVLMKKIK